LIDYDSREYASEWEPVKHGISQGSVPGPLFSLLYVNDIPNISDISNPILFSGHKSIIFTNSDLSGV